MARGATGSTKIHEETGETLSRIMFAESRFGGVDGVQAFVVGREEKVQIPEGLPEELKGIFGMVSGRKEAIFFPFIVRHRRWSLRYWLVRFVFRKGHDSSQRRIIPCRNEEEALEKAMQYYQHGTVAVDTITQGMADRVNVELMTRGMK